MVDSIDHINDRTMFFFNIQVIV